MVGWPIGGITEHTRYRTRTPATKGINLELKVLFRPRVSFVLLRIFAGLGLAGPNLVVVVQNSARRRRGLPGIDIGHKAAVGGQFPDVGFGRVGLAQLRIVAEQRIGHRIAPVKINNVQKGCRFKRSPPIGAALSSPSCEG
jgi:hypothetical protein